MFRRKDNTKNYAALFSQNDLSSINTEEKQNLLYLTMPSPFVTYTKNDSLAPNTVTVGFYGIPSHTVEQNFTIFDIPARQSFHSRENTLIIRRN